MKILRTKGSACENHFLKTISHLGPTHLQRVFPSLGDSLRQTGPPYLPILNCEA